MTDSLNKGLAIGIFVAEAFTKEDKNFSGRLLKCLLLNVQ